MNRAPSHRLNRLRLRPYLERCGYRSALIETEVALPENGRTALAAFAYAPRDSRSACIAAIDGFTDPHQDAVACRALGTPVILVCLPDELQWWITGTTGTALRERSPASDIDRFFDQHRGSFAPGIIYRAKTMGRFDQHHQLEFVDVGLMPLIEAEAGRKLVDLLVRAVHRCKNRLGWKVVSEAEGHWLLKANFWLLAAKILKDKQVEAFVELSLSDLDTVYERLAGHYGASDPVPVGPKQRREALRESAEEISQFSDLGLVSTEALAHLYENALITKETRAELGTHSTPAYLVDYIVAKLRPWIEDTPWRQRRVFEPACGHAAFMLASMRLLGELLPAGMSTPSSRHRYLRQRLHGCDYDPFALEIARLSLTLADVPNPNGWDLRATNMFEKDILAAGARNASLVLANPPFDNFSSREREDLERSGGAPDFSSKAAEMLWRVASSMRPGAALGVVLPQGVLHSNNTTALRRLLAKDFEIREICLFPDKSFTFSDAESAVIMARRVSRSDYARKPIAYRRIRESDMEEFKRTFRSTTDTLVSQSDLFANERCEFLVPDLAEVWDFCRKYPRLRSIADVGQGLTYRSFNDPRFPSGQVTESPIPRKGFVPGFARLRRSLQTHDLPNPIWLNLDAQVISNRCRGTTAGVPQVLLNYARVSRGPWRLKAFLDQKGHPVISRFLVIRPSDRNCALETVWAICNSPFANAYSYAFSGKRDILAGRVRELPLPRMDGVDLRPLIQAVRSYFKAARDAPEASRGAAIEEELRVLHWRIDAEVLRLYQLPEQLEHQVLMLFSGETRRGVPFVQNEYLPKGFGDPVSLKDLLAVTYDWERTNERRAQLLLADERDDLGRTEQAELTHLQHLADVRIRLLTPLPLAELDRITADLKRRGLWVGGEE